MKKKTIFLLIPLIFQIVVSCAQVEVRISDSLIPYPNSVQFYVFGDWGRKGQALADPVAVKNQEMLAQTMDQVGAIFKPEFIISTGDNFYPDGVMSDIDPRWKETFEDVYSGRFLQCRWYVVLGNHDHNGNVNGEIEYSKKSLNNRWYMPANYYSQGLTTPDGAKVKFIFIDTTPLVKDGDEQQRSWLSRELAEGSYDWKFVVGHHPLYSGNHRVKEQVNLRKAIEALLIENKVDVYLCGHDHNLQHLRKDNINYFISGAGSEIRGSPPIENLTEYVYCQDGVSCTSAFMIFSLDKSGMFVQMVDSRGKLIHKTRVEKRQH